MKHRTQTNDTPVTANVDISTSIIAEVPQLMGFTYWVETAGGPSAGAFQMDLTWLDIAGQSRSLDGTPINLQDPDASFTSQVTVIRRQSDTSQFDIVKQLIGLDDGAVIGYSVFLTSGSQSDVSYF